MRIGCCGGAAMLLGITLERDVQYYDYEVYVYNRKASSAFAGVAGDTAEELIAERRGFYEKLFGVWKEGYPGK